MSWGVGCIFSGFAQLLTRVVTKKEILGEMLPKRRDKEGRSEAQNDSFRSDMGRGEMCTSEDLNQLRGGKGGGGTF